MTKDTENVLAILGRVGITREDAQSLRRISMTLRRWFELECGTDNGAVERDEKTNKPYFISQPSGRRSPVADREAGAMKRLGSIMARYPTLKPYIQGDCRGAALYILRPGDVPDGQDAGSYYSRGLVVY